MDSIAVLTGERSDESAEPSATVLIAQLLAATVHSNDPVLADVMDQAQPSLDGAWGGSTFEDRALIAVARCVAKSANGPTFHHLRELLLEFGVRDWTSFVEYVVIPHSGPYAHEMASFQSQQHYRLVDIADLPAPLFPPHRLPPRLLGSWNELAQPQRGRFWRQAETPTPAQVEVAWLERHRSDYAADWQLGQVDWAPIQAAAVSLYFRRAADWSKENVEEYAASLSESLAHGVRSLIFDPISWAGGDAGLTNGPHRKLAMQLQGVDQVLICTR